MAIAIVQQAFADSGIGGANPTVSISPTVAGNLLVIVAGYGPATVTVVGAHDNSGNPFVHASNATAGSSGSQADVWYLENCAAGQIGVALNFSTDPGHCIFTVYEIAGTKTSGSFDAANNLQATGPGVSPTLTPSVVGELLLTCAYTGDVLFTDVQSPWTTDQADPGAVNGYCSGHFLNPLLTSQQAIFDPTTSVNFGSTVVGFLPRPSSGAIASDMFLVF